MKSANRRKWLIIRNGAVGDTVLLSPAVRCARLSEPAADIAVMGPPERVGLLTGPGMADRAEDFERPGIESLYAAGGPLDPRLAAFLAEYDVVVFYRAKPPGGLAERMTVRPGQKVVVHPALPAGGGMHITRHYLRALDGLIEPSDPPLPGIPLTEAERRAARRWLEGLEGLDPGGPMPVGVHAGAGSQEKRAGIRRFNAELAPHMEAPGAWILLINGPADGGATAAFMERSAFADRAVVVESPPLRELAAMLSHCRRVIGNDSGVAHMAAAVGAPVTVFFIASDPAVWAPLGPNVKVVDSRGCAPAD